MAQVAQIWRVIWRFYINGVQAAPDQHMDFPVPTANAQATAVARCADQIPSFLTQTATSSRPATSTAIISSSQIG